MKILDELANVSTRREVDSLARGCDRPAMRFETGRPASYDRCARNPRRPRRHHHHHHHRSACVTTTLYYRDAVRVSGSTRLSTYPPVLYSPFLRISGLIFLSRCVYIFFPFSISLRLTPFGSSLTHFRGADSYGLSLLTFGTDFHSADHGRRFDVAFFARFDPRIVCVIGKHCV